jgi:hypothetical protein
VNINERWRLRQAAAFDRKTTDKLASRAGDRQEFLHIKMLGSLVHGRVAYLVSQGWEIASTEPNMIRGTGMGTIFLLRKRNPNFKDLDQKSHLG